MPMLVLTRKRGESIVISGDITVTVVEIYRNKVRLGIEAPPNLPIYREELLLKKGAVSAPQAPIRQH